VKVKVTVEFVHASPMAGLFGLLPSPSVQYGLISRYSTRLDPSTIAAKNSRLRVVVIVSILSLISGHRRRVITHSG
jgi:hypothetical protein